MSRNKSFKTAMTMMVAAAILAPATASARPIDPPLPDVKAVAAQPQAPSNLPLGAWRGRDGVNDLVKNGTFEPSPVPATNSVDASPGGFDWGDAAIGAAAMLALLSLGACMVRVGRRGRGRGQPAAAS
jgi:hypothetical protein